MALTKLELQMIDRAEQQLRGFIHAVQGYDLEQLVISMGLTKKEWDVMRKDCNYLPPGFIEALN